jgi:type II pantothenate kinase
MGTGTAFVHAKMTEDGPKIKYLGGTGVGGGTLVGLSKKMIGVDTVEHIETLCEDGNLDNVDLKIKHISADNSFQINEELTASNFGMLSDMATKNDLALGIANMVAETIMMLGVFAARNYNLKNVVLTGNLTSLSAITSVFTKFEDLFDIKFILPENAQFATVIGAALGGVEE